MKRPILVFYSMLLGCTATYGQQDVTSIYLANPSFEEDAKACTQDSPDALYEGCEDGTCRPKDGKLPVLEKPSLLTRNVPQTMDSARRKQPTGILPTTNVSVGAVQIRK